VQRQRGQRAVRSLGGAEGLFGDVRWRAVLTRLLPLSLPPSLSLSLSLSLLLPPPSPFAACDVALFRFAEKPSSALTLPLHRDTVALLTARCAALVDEKERRREELAQSGAEIAHLWTLLRIPQQEREAFQTSFKMNLSLETLAKGRQVSGARDGCGCVGV